MKRSTTACLGCCLVLFQWTVSPVCGQDPVIAPARSQLRVGTFDSRLVATAYVRSEAFHKRLVKLQSEIDAAKARGAEKRVKELEARGPALQHLVHKQAFSTWPVHDILQTIKPQLPQIAKQAGVDLIVSKWDVAYQRPGVETVDVTDFMVALFQPDDATRKVLESLRKQDPVPLERLQNQK